MSRNRLGFPVPLLALSMLALCAAPEPTLGQQPIARILLGQETDDFPAVGIVGSLRRGGFCTGTLISPTHVLTAAHCAEVVESSTSGTFQLGDQLYGTTDILIHPDYNSLSLANDIAILQLNEPVLDTQPSEIMRQEPLVGDLLFIVGFGATGSASGGSDGSFGTKRVGVTTIDEVTSTLVSWIFDDESETNTAAGDSGGPGYIDIDGELFVASVTSGGTEPDSVLGDFAFNTRVDAFSLWIDLTIAAAVDQPSTDQPSTEQPSDDPIWSQPFPLLQLLINFLTQLLEFLIDQGSTETEPAETPAETPTLPDDTPTTETPVQPSDTPATEAPADCPVQNPVTPPDPATEPTDPVTDPTTGPPVTEDPVEITQPPSTTAPTEPGGIATQESVTPTSTLGTRFNRLRESLGAITDFQRWSIFRLRPSQEDR